MLREIDRRIAFEDANEATRKSKEDPDASYWACVAWRGRGRHRRPQEWRGYVDGLWCMTVRHARRGLFYATVVVAGTTVALRPTTTGKDAQRAAYARLLDADVPVVPYKPRRKPKTEAANQAAKVKASEIEAFQSAFNLKNRSA